MVELIEILVAPIAALLGVAVGGWFSASSARTSSLFQWSTGLMKEGREFYAEAAGSANELYVAYGALVQDLSETKEKVRLSAREQGIKPNTPMNFRYEFKPGHKERIAEAITAFRACLAKAVVHADQNLSRALQDLDHQRERLTVAINSGDFINNDLAVELERLELHLKPVYMAIQLLKDEQNMVIANNAPRRIRREMTKKLQVSHGLNQTKLAQSIEAAKVAQDVSPAPSSAS